MLKYFLLLFLIPVFCFSQNAQKTTISGVVYENETNQPLSDANVVLEGFKAGTTTGKNGKFVLPDIPAGNYVLKVSFMGYQKYQKNITVKNAQNIELTVKLSPTQIIGKEINVTAKKTINTFEHSNRITVITDSVIAAAPVRSLPELIDFMPGINMSNTYGIYSTKTVVTLHGLPSNDQSRTLVLMDGIPMNKSDEGTVNWNMINKDNVQSVKVIKGPGPAQYGSGAMGGVIEITSKKPDKKLQGNALAEYGTYNTMLASLNFCGIKNDSASNNSLYWGVSGMGRKSDGYITELKEYMTVVDTILVPTYLKEWSVSGKAGYNVKDNHNIELQCNYYDDIRGNGVKVFEDMGAYSTHRTLSGIAKYSGKTDLFKWDANVFNLYEHYIRQYEYMKEGEYQLYEANSKRKDFGGGLNFISNKFLQSEITTGVNYKQGSVDGSDTYFTSTDVISNTGNMETYAVFIQDETKLFNDKLNINVGVRYDLAHFYNGLFTIDYPSYSIEFYENFENRSVAKKHWNAFCPRFSSQYLFSHNDRIYMTVAKGFRAPILDDMTRTGKKRQGFSVANPDLKPELITTYEIGADKAITKNFKANGSVYYSIGSDFMYLVSTGDSVNMGYKKAPVQKMSNIGKVEIYGAETELKYDFKENISVFVNYSYTHAQIKEHIINDAKVDSNLTGKYLTDVPKHKISGGITWRNKFVNSTLLVKYIGKTWINDLNSVDEEYLKTDMYPAYTTLNIRFDRKIVKGLMASLSIENIFNEIYVTNSAHICPGRLINGSLRYNF
ncbi:MAG: TonB-dependent receptor [Bacteroidales bacterium]|nr:TonB-dependent receptor [Bacteroidales bacterium]